jgi:hypothetical protein
VFEPRHTSARRALEAFLPSAGADYSRSRNYDFGRERRDNVSTLSPWVRLRVLPEWAVISAVLRQHTVAGAAKFIDEVCWRTYWKGWLMRRPAVWDDYLSELSKQRTSPLYQSTIAGESGIDCMDAWTRELIETGYLHNHARMWYASIWIHTLKLPWTLGADFFLKHLYDGDAASNTLSWRWVAGLHTEGKTYLASAENIKKYTEGRFHPQTEFATEPVDVSGSPCNPPAVAFKPLAPSPRGQRVGVLLHEEDLSAREWIRGDEEVIATAGFFPKAAYQQHGIAQPVAAFRQACMRDALSGGGESSEVYTQLSEVLQWAQAMQLDTLLMAEPPIGIWNSVLPELQDALQEHNIALVYKRHWWDAHFYPHAQAGFFRFKKAIPTAINQLI